MLRIELECIEISNHGALNQSMQHTKLAMGRSLQYESWPLVYTRIQD